LWAIVSLKELYRVQLHLGVLHTLRCIDIHILVKKSS